MSSKPPVRLIASEITHRDLVYQEILTWPYRADPFYEAQVLRLLSRDVPTRAIAGECTVLVFRDEDGTAVGFGTVERSCIDYSALCDSKPHGYLAVLGVHPRHQGKGYGSYIFDHLCGLVIADLNGPEFLIPDVYVSNANAIRMYEKRGFVILNPDEPILDPLENNQPYHVMGKRLRTAGKPAAK